jgi:hypothetical protein
LKSVAELMKPANVLKMRLTGNSLFRNSRSKNGGAGKYGLL